MTEFSQFNLSGLTVLIRRIIGNINTLPSISLCIPFIQKACILILGDALKEITYRRITTFPFAVVPRIGKWSVCCSLSRSFSIVTCSPLQLNVSNAIVLLFTARTVTVNFLWVELQKKERVSALSLETCIQIFIFSSFWRPWLHRQAGESLQICNIFSILMIIQICCINRLSFHSEIHLSI